MDEAPVAEEAAGKGVTQAAGKAGAGGAVGEVSSGFAEGNKAGEGPVSPIDLEDVDLDDLYTGTPPAPSHWTTEHLCNYWKRPLVQSLWLFLIGVVLIDIMVAMDYWGGEHALTLLRVSYWLCLVGLIFNALGTANSLRMLPDMMQESQDLTAKGFVWVGELDRVAAPCFLVGIACMFIGALFGIAATIILIVMPGDVSIFDKTNTYRTWMVVDCLIWSVSCLFFVVAIVLALYSIISVSQLVEKHMRCKMKYWLGKEFWLLVIFGVISFLALLCCILYTIEAKRDFRDSHTFAFTTFLLFFDLAIATLAMLAFVIVEFVDLQDSWERALTKMIIEAREGQPLSEGASESEAYGAV